MNTEDYINEYIRKEKATQPNPYLASRIMTKIEQPQRLAFTQRTTLQVSIWQTVAIVASFVLVIAAGISTGSIYSDNQFGATALNIDDNQIENRNFMNELAYE